MPKLTFTILNQTTGLGFQLLGMCNIQGYQHEVSVLVMTNCGLAPGLDELNVEPVNWGQLTGVVAGCQKALGIGDVKAYENLVRSWTEARTHADPEVAKAAEVLGGAKRVGDEFDPPKPEDYAGQNIFLFATVEDNLPAYQVALKDLTNFLDEVEKCEAKLKESPSSPTSESIGS